MTNSTDTWRPAAVPRLTRPHLLAFGAFICLSWSMPCARMISGAPTDQDKKPQPFVENVPGSARPLTMLPIPAGKLNGLDAKGQATEQTIAGFWMSDTEVTWELFDVLVYEKDLKVPSSTLPPDGVDAVTRPTRPYISVDRGWGHEGWPAISISHASALSFCEWLSASTGRAWRLPTEAEWEYACRAGATGKWSWGDDPDDADDHAWYRNNAGRKTHRVATREANAFGLFDMHGNAAEWCAGGDGKPLLAGGSYYDRLDRLTCTYRRHPTEAWNASDPNLPKSPWWLADAPFAGFRVVCETPPQTPAHTPPGATENKDKQ